MSLPIASPPLSCSWWPGRAFIFGWYSYTGLLRWSRADFDWAFQVKSRFAQRIRLQFQQSVLGSSPCRALSSFSSSTFWMSRTTFLSFSHKWAMSECKCRISPVAIVSRPSTVSLDVYSTPPDETVPSKCVRVEWIEKKLRESLFWLWVLFFFFFWSRWFARFFLDEQMDVSGEEDGKNTCETHNTLCIEPIDVVGRRGGNRWRGLPFFRNFLLSNVGWLSRGIVTAIHRNGSCRDFFFFVISRFLLGIFVDSELEEESRWQG